MYCMIFSYIGVVSGVNVGKYAIHGVSGIHDFHRKATFENATEESEKEMTYSN